jgi:hypothetical protein
LPPELFAGAGAVVEGDVAPGPDGGDFDELPQPASAIETPATAIAIVATFVTLRFAIVDLRNQARCE